MIAESIIGAASEMNIHVPMVVRLQGTNSEAGLKLVSAAMTIIASAADCESWRMQI